MGVALCVEKVEVGTYTVMSDYHVTQTFLKRKAVEVVHYRGIAYGVCLEGPMKKISCFCAILYMSYPDSVSWCIPTAPLPACMYFVL